MSISLETTPITPNAVYAPQILLQTCIVGGKLQTSAQLFLAAAKVENSGELTETWTPTGQSSMVCLGDIANLDEDLASLQSSVTTLYAEIVQLLGSLNSIRKAL